MRVIIYSEKGYKKVICEDAALLNEYIISDSFSETQINSRALIAIADGVGGNAGGELASRYILNQFDKINIEDITAEELHQFIENVIQVYWNMQNSFQVKKTWQLRLQE